MSTGYGANSAHTIDKENIIKVVGNKELVDTFVEKFNSYPFDETEVHDLDVLAQTLSGENPGDINTDRPEYKELFDLWDEISGKFTNSTNISIWPEYHNVEESGDCHDMVDGLYFSVSFGDIYEPTKEYKDLQSKFGDIVDEVFFVRYG